VSHALLSERLKRLLRQRGLLSARALAHADAKLLSESACAGGASASCTPPHRLPLRPPAPRSAQRAPLGSGAVPQGAGRRVRHAAPAVSITQSHAARGARQGRRRGRGVGRPCSQWRRRRSWPRWSGGQHRGAHRVGAAGRGACGRLDRRGPIPAPHSWICCCAPTQHPFPPPPQRLRRSALPRHCRAAPLPPSCPPSATRHPTPSSCVQWHGNLDPRVSSSADVTRSLSRAAVTGGDDHEHPPPLPHPLAPAPVQKSGSSASSSGIATMSRDLDQLLGHGVPTGAITELCQCAAARASPAAVATHHPRVATTARRWRAGRGQDAAVHAAVRVRLHARGVWRRGGRGGVH
jgi:hypothetical protein